MAQKKWIVLPGGRIKRWKYSRRNQWGGTPPRWFRNNLNRRERRKSKVALIKGKAVNFPYMHPKSAAWLYW